MNIFVVDQDPTICAQALDNLRLNKMIIETAQLLSTAMRECGHIGTDIYKSTHRNHPCAIWARESSGNYEWLLHYMSELVIERFSRTGKSHKSYNIFNTLQAGSCLLPQGPMTPFVNCSLRKDLPVFEAYKETLKTKWGNDKVKPSWMHFGPPPWARCIG